MEDNCPTILSWFLPYINRNQPCVLCLVIQSCLALCDPMDYSLPGSSVHGDSAVKSTGVGCHTLLQEILPTQELNSGLQHYWCILYHLSHHESPDHPLPLEPPSHLPLHPNTLGCPRARDLSSLHHTVKSHWLLNFTYGSVHVSMLLSHFISPSPSPAVPTSLFSMSVLSHINAYIWNLERGNDEPICRLAVGIILS